MTKRYVAFWNAGSFYVEGNESEVVNEDFFTEEKGYSEEDIAGIQALRLGRVWVSLDHGFSHLVIRVE